jgi:multiple sugar transport system substrate-binding protein
VKVPKKEESMRVREAIRARWRTAAAVLVVGMAALAVAACGGDDDDGGGTAGGGDAGGGGETASAECRPSSDGPVRLTFWSWVPGVEQAVDRWNEQNPDVQVRVRTTPAGNAGTYQNMFNALEAGNPPDLGQIEYDSLPSFRLQDGVANIGPCGAADVQDRFIDWTWQQVTFGEDAVYAIPQDTGPMALYYRADLFEEYGIEVPETWEEFRAAAERVHEQDPDVYLTHFPQRDTNWFAGLAWQAGAKWFGLEGDAWQVSIDDEPTQRVAAYWQDLIERDLVANLQGFSEEWNKALADGKVISWVSAVWGNNTITTNAPKTKGDWRVAPMPQWEGGEQRAGNWGGSTTAVFNGSEHPYEAAQFALWLNTDPEALEILNREGGLYPATTAGLELEPLQQPQPFFGGENIFAVFAEAAQNVDQSWAWGPIMTTTYSDLADGFGRALNGGSTLPEAIAAAEEGTVSAMQQQGLQVAGR